jgi:hypothetical protein
MTDVPVSPNILHDNAKAHTADAVEDLLRLWRWEVHRQTDKWLMSGLISLKRSQYTESRSTCTFSKIHAGLCRPDNNKRFISCKRSLQLDISFIDEFPNRHQSVFGQMPKLRKYRAVTLPVILYDAEGNRWSEH